MSLSSTKVWTKSDSRVPIVAVIFPVTAFSGKYVREGADDLDVIDPLRALVAELRRNLHPDGRAVIGIDRSVIEVQGQDRLGVRGLAQIETLVVRRPLIVDVHTMEDDVTRALLRLDHR